MTSTRTHRLSRISAAFGLAAAITSGALGVSPVGAQDGPVDPSPQSSTTFTVRDRSETGARAVITIPCVIDVGKPAKSGDSVKASIKVTCAQRVSTLRIVGAMARQRQGTSRWTIVAANNGSSALSNKVSLTLSTPCNVTGNHWYQAKLQAGTATTLNGLFPMPPVAGRPALIRC